MGRNRFVRPSCLQMIHSEISRKYRHIVTNYYMQRQYKANLRVDYVKNMFFSNKMTHREGSPVGPAIHHIVTRSRPIISPPISYSSFSHYLHRRIVLLFIIYNITQQNIHGPWQVCTSQNLPYTIRLIHNSFAIYYQVQSRDYLLRL